MVASCCGLWLIDACRRVKTRFMDLGDVIPHLRDLSLLVLLLV